MRDPIAIYELGKARQRDLEAEVSGHRCAQAIEANARNSTPYRRFFGLGSLILSAQAIARQLIG